MHTDSRSMHQLPSQGLASPPSRVVSRVLGAWTAQVVAFVDLPSLLALLKLQLANLTHGASANSMQPTHRGKGCLTGGMECM